MAPPKRRQQRALLLLACALLQLAAAALPAAAQADVPQQEVLDPTTIPKYTSELSIPQPYEQADYYEISLKQKTQQVLPEGFPATTVWAYGPTGAPLDQYGWPAKTIEAQVGTPIRVKWSNELRDPATGACLPHIIDAVDQTLHWAYPQGGADGRDSNPCKKACSDERPFRCNATMACRLAASGTYQGPVPMVTHVHGQELVGDESDGHAEAWFLPANCTNLAEGYATEGSWYGTFKAKFEKNNPGFQWSPGSATFIYPNQQPASHLWYHDHTVGITRLNVYAGTVGNFFIRNASFGAPERPGLPFPPPGATPEATTSTAIRELPINIQDRAFKTDGSLYYPVRKSVSETSRLPNRPIHPYWLSGFFPKDGEGNSLAMMVVNGKTWPRVTVARSAYRLRLLNGCNSRTLKISFSLTPPDSTGGDTRPQNEERLPFTVIGTEAGFLTAPTTRDQLLMGNGDRFDVVLDFSKPEFRGKSIYLRNAGPESFYLSPQDEGEEFPPETTAQIMRFDVLDTDEVDDGTGSAATAATPGPAPRRYRFTPPPIRTRKFSLATGKLGQGMYQGNVGEKGEAIIKMWDDQVEANPELGTTEEWVWINYSPDAHPMHIHARAFTVVKRETIELSTDENGLLTYTVTGNLTEAPFEVLCSPGQCYEDTVMVYAGTAVTVRITFPLPGVPVNSGDPSGLFQWHCHLLEHEDNEMMLPFCIGQPGHKDPKTGENICPLSDP